MKKLLLFVLFAAGAAAQQAQPVSSLQEDCFRTFSFTAQSSGAQAAGTVVAGSTGTTSVIDNRQTGCLDFLIVYNTTTTVTALSLLFQTATDLAGVPGTWSAYAGTLTSGINPNTAATPPWAFTDATGPAFPFLRINMTGFTGPGTVYGRIYGWKRRPSYVTAVIAPGTICTSAAPCPVDGPTAAGSAPVTPPVLVAGQDGAPGSIRTLLTDSLGRQIVVGAAADGAAKAGNPVRVGGLDVITPGGGAGVNMETIALNAFGGIVAASVAAAAGDGVSNTFEQERVINNAGTINVAFQKTAPSIFNGSTWDRQFDCASQTTVALTDATRTQLVALSGTTIIRVCHIHVTTTAVEDVTLSYGTGSACGTGTATIDKYLSVQSFAMDFQPTAALRTIAANALCVTQSGAMQNAQVTVIYAQY